MTDADQGSQLLGRFPLARSEARADGRHGDGLIAARHLCRLGDDRAIDAPRECHGHATVAAKKGQQAVSLLDQSRIEFAHTSTISPECLAIHRLAAAKGHFDREGRAWATVVRSSRLEVLGRLNRKERMKAGLTAIAAFGMEMFLIVGLVAAACR